MTFTVKCFFCYFFETYVTVTLNDQLHGQTEFSRVLAALAAKQQTLDSGQQFFRGSRVTEDFFYGRIQAGRDLFKGNDRIHQLILLCSGEYKQPCRLKFDNEYHAACIRIFSNKIWFGGRSENQDAQIGPVICKDKSCTSMRHDSIVIGNDTFVWKGDGIVRDQCFQLLAGRKISKILITH